MPGGPIILRYSADISEATKGTADLADAVTDVGDAADDSAKRSGAAADVMLADRKAAAKQILAITRNQALEEAREWKASALAAGRSTEDVEQAYQQMAQTIERSTGTMFAKLNTASTENIGKIERGIVGLRGNLAGMFQQVGISFDWSDPVGSATNALSGLAFAIPGIGGLIGGALGGIASGFVENWQKAAQESEERIATMYQNMLESGQNFLTQEQVQKAVEDIGNDTKKFAAAQQDAKLSGIDLNVILRAQAGDAGALSTVNQLLSEKYRDVQTEMEKVKGSRAGLVAGLPGESGHLQDLISKYSGTNSEMSQAATRAEAVRSALESMGASAGDASKQADAVGRSVANLPSEKTMRVVLDSSDAQRKLHELANTPVNIPGNLVIAGRSGFKVD